MTLKIYIRGHPYLTRIYFTKEGGKTSNLKGLKGKKRAISELVLLCNPPNRVWLSVQLVHWAALGHLKGCNKGTARTEL